MFELPDKITIWNAQGNDGFGGLTWSSPVVYDSRNALKQQKFTDANGDERVSTSVCYSEGEQLKIGSIVYFGESASVEPVSSANDVRAISQIPSGAGDLKKAWLL